MFSYISKETPPILNVYETLNETFKIFEAFSLGFSKKKDTKVIDSKA